MNRQRLFRLAAVCDWFIAVLVAVPAGATLYAIRTGRFHNYWLEPTEWARTQEWGLALSLMCVICGFALWRLTMWSRWLETALFVPKLYCGYIALFVYAMSHAFLFLFVAVLAFLNVGIVVLLWVLKSPQFVLIASQ